MMCHTFIARSRADLERRVERREGDRRGVRRERERDRGEELACQNRGRTSWRRGGSGERLHRGTVPGRIRPPPSATAAAAAKKKKRKKERTKERTKERKNERENEREKERTNERKNERRNSPRGCGGHQGSERRQRVAASSANESHDVYTRSHLVR